MGFRRAEMDKECLSARMLCILIDMSQTQIGISILRFGLATVFIWFGVSQLLNPTEWIGWVPVWAMELSGLSDMTILKINAFVEIVGGALLAFGIYTRVVAAVLAVHVALIT